MVALDDRRRDVGHVVGDAVVAPEELAVADARTPTSAAADELHVLLHAAAVRDHDRRVAGAVLAPARRASAPAARQISLPVACRARPAARARRPGVTITRSPSTSGDSLQLPASTSSGRRSRAAGCLRQRSLPVAASTHDEVALGAERVDEVAVHGRRAARPAVSRRPRAGRPSPSTALLPSAAFERDQRAGAPSRSPMRVDAAAGDGDAGEAAAEARSPSRPAAGRPRRQLRSSPVSVRRRRRGWARATAASRARPPRRRSRRRLRR